MKCFLKHLKPIAYLFALLVLLQSCVVYEKTSSSVKEASQYNDRRMKIKTIDGNKYKLNWIEEKDGNVVSIKNTKRAFVDKSKITQILPDGVTLEFVLKHDVAVQIKTKKYTYDFIKIKEQDDLVKGFIKVSGDTTTVVIPIDQIEKIKLENKEMSKTGDTLIAVGAILGTVVTVGYLSLLNTSWY